MRSRGDILGYIWLEQDALHRAASVAELDEDEFAFFRFVVHPTIECYLFSDVIGEVFNRNEAFVAGLHIGCLCIASENQNGKSTTPEDGIMASE